MTHSDKRAGQAARILDELQDLLSEDRLTAWIDKPIDSAAEEFVAGMVGAPAGGLHAVLPHFVRHIFATSPWLARELPDAEAHDEAVAILNDVLRESECSGHDAAMAAMRADPQTGVYVVLMAIADGIKARARYVYKRWVEVRLVSSATWQTRCEIAELLLLRGNPWFPAHLKDQPPESLAGHILSLLEQDMGTDAELYRPTSVH